MKQLYSNAAQSILDRLLANRMATFTQKVESRCLRELRRRMCQYHDPIVQCRIGAQWLELPFSHQLPLFLQSFPTYSRNLGRLGKIIYSRDSTMTCVDIGANVGDSIALMRSDAHFPILGIEADQFYFSLLEKNTHSLLDVEIVHALVADEKQLSPGTLVRSGGTGRIVPEVVAATGKGIGKQDLCAMELQSILALHPRFHRPRLLKLDTDGYDCKILMGAADILSDSQPILFFEYDPSLFNGVDTEGSKIFQYLLSLGYASVIFYDNTGPYSFTVDLNDTRMLEDVYAMALSPGGPNYFDVAAFHADDKDLSDTLRKQELTFSS